MSKIVTNVTNINAISSSLTSKVSKSGDTMTGNLVTPSHNVNSRRQLDLQDGGNLTGAGDYNNLSPNTQYYKTSVVTNQPPMQNGASGGYSSIVQYLSNLNGVNAADLDASERAVQLSFADVIGNKFIRSKQGTSGWHSWERILTDCDFRTDLYTMSGTNSVTSTSWVDVWSFTHTPRRQNARIVMFWRIGGYWQPNGDAYAQVLRDGTAIYENDRIAGNGSTQHETCAFYLIDSPNSTGTVTYKLQVKVSGGAFDVSHGLNSTQCLVMEFANGV